MVAFSEIKQTLQNIRERGTRLLQVISDRQKRGTPPFNRQNSDWLSYHETFYPLEKDQTLFRVLENFKKRALKLPF